MPKSLPKQAWLRNCENVKRPAAATATEIITSKLDNEAGLALIDSAAAEIEKLN